MAPSGTALVNQRLKEADIDNAHVVVRQFDSERIYLISVPEHHLPRAVEVGQSLEIELAGESDSVVVTIRPVKRTTIDHLGPVKNLEDPRIDALVQLLTSRSRTSEAQPSLAYIPNNTANLARVTGARHHLIFGRRGAGKTALLLEAKRRIELDHLSTAWLNMQPFRNESIERIFLHVASRVVAALKAQAIQQNLNKTEFYTLLNKMSDQLQNLLDEPITSPSIVRRIVPSLQMAVQRATASTGGRLYVFLDDFYYIPRGMQAEVLDLLHSSIRDADIWLKIASIRHLTRWFRPSPPTGLQTGQDVDLVDLDLSLQDPSAAVDFLTKVLKEYCEHSHISNIHHVITREAVDRLVFGSGGVPRDFLTLAAAAISKDRARPGARAVGVSAVNQAAGEAARSKLGELEDDLASNIGYSEQTYHALTRVREFCLDQKSYTYFRVDFRDKEKHPDEYGVLTRLLEVRLVHLIDASVSYADKAGERSECYTLDLSQYSGSRLKQGLRVLDLQDGLLVSKQTRTLNRNVDGKSPTGVVTGKTAREVLGILRKAPLLELSTFERLVQTYEPAIDDIERVLAGRRSMTIDELVDALNRPYLEVRSAATTLIDRGRLELIDAEGTPAYKMRRD